MRNLFRNNRKLIALMGVLFTGIMVITGITAVLLGESGDLLFAESGAGGSTSQEESSGAGTAGEVPGGDAEIPVLAPVTYNKPDEMKGCYLVPGVDFLIGQDRSEAKVKAEIDAALSKAAEFTLNTVIIQTAGKDGVIYNSKNLPVLTEFFDPLTYAISQARAKGMFVYCIYNTMEIGNGTLMSRAAGLDATVVDFIRNEVGDFAGKYHPDGIFLDDYYNEKTESSYAAYLTHGGGIGYENYMKSVSKMALTTAAGAIRDKAPGMQVGILTDAVWANKSQNEAGSNTKAVFTALESGNADVKNFVGEKLFDFVAVKAYGSTGDGAEPFDTVVTWWGKVANEAGVPMYVVHGADQMGTAKAGWGSNTEMVRQLNNVKTVTGYHGSIFNSLAALVANPGGATDNLMKYLTNQTSAQFILSELKLTKPEKTTYTTNEATVMFQGASDPTNPVTLGGKEISTDANGYFSVSENLVAGKNTFVFKHKEKTITYLITRQVKVLDGGVSPSGSVTVDGGMKITVSVSAYAGAHVTASLGGSSITLSETRAEDDDTDKSSSYVKFTGDFTAPEGTSSTQKLGTISVKATYEGFTDSASGATVTVNKKAAIGSGRPVVVTASQAETFPGNTMNDISSPYCFPLPGGALDYTLGDEIVYRDGSKTYRYYMLESGLRVYSKDISSTGKEAGDNVIKGMSVSNNGTYTDVILTMTQPVSYDASYSSGGMTFDFAYTKTAPGNLSSLSKNPLFSSATWNGTKLNLRFRESDGMVGYKASYSGNTLTLRFNNVPTMDSARIVIDPGHSGPDNGASGNLSDYPEKVVNQQIAKRLYNVLVNTYGANVYLINTTGGSKVELADRVAQAESYNPHLFLSIHCNSAANTSAKGNESYYFYGFSESLSGYVNSGLYSAMGNANRGSKYGLYYVTRTSRYASTLAECGFMSNNSEYKQLLDSNTQQSIASNMAKAISSYFSSIRTSGYGTGTETVGAVSQVAVTGITLDKPALTLKTGETAPLKGTIAPAEASNQTVKWSTSDSKVATVSGEGVVTGVSAGNAVITATTEDGGKTATCKVTVAGTGVAGVTLNKTQLKLTVGESESLIATVTPDSVANRRVTWKSDNESVATVNADGRVTAKAAGTANITVTTADGGKTAVCGVTVTAGNVPVTGVSLTPGEITLNKGESQQLTVAVAPENATNQNLSWSTSNSGVAAVGAGGKVSAVGTGTATITVTTGDGGKTAVCKVTVAQESVPVREVTLDKGTMELLVGDKGTLTATVHPENATNPNSSWSSSNSGVATVSAAGVVTAVAPGSAVITATAQGKSASCTVTVKAAPPAVVAVTGVGLSTNELKAVLGDAPVKLSAAIAPENAANRNISWSTSNSAVAAVGADGTVTFVGVGSATITVTTADGGHTAQCGVTVVATTNPPPADAAPAGHGEPKA